MRISLLLALTLVACGESSDQSDTASQEQAPATEVAAEVQLPDIVSLAATVARQIEADPNRAAEILEQHELSLESFEEMLFDISRDAELSKAYAEAKSKP